MRSTGNLLIVVYEHAGENRKTIRVNDGYDILQSHPGYCTDDERSNRIRTIYRILKPELHVSDATPVAVVKRPPRRGKERFPLQ